MNAENHTVACLTGEFEGAQRDIIIDSFRSGQCKVLIATNVLSRGIDVQTVSLVVNYVSRADYDISLSHSPLLRISQTTLGVRSTLRLTFIVSVVQAALDVSASQLASSAALGTIKRSRRSLATLALT